MYFKNTLHAFMLAGEEGGGSEVVQTVLVLAVALGLGAALLGIMNANFIPSIKTAGSEMSNLFNGLSGAGK